MIQLVLASFLGSCVICATAADCQHFTQVSTTIWDGDYSYPSTEYWAHIWDFWQAKGDIS